MRNRHWFMLGFIVGVLLSILLLYISPPTVRAGDEDCYPIPMTAYSPSGIAGCTLDGSTDGIASWYGGAVAAANWCTWPFDDCGYAQVQSHQTGAIITVPIGMYCDCYWFTDRRLIDMTEAQVRTLGENPADGLFEVTVTPLRTNPTPISSRLTLPDTALGSLDIGFIVAMLGFSCLMLAAFAMERRK